MRSKFLIGSLLASAMLVSAAFAQQPAQPAPKAQAQKEAETPTLTQKAGQWRASKVAGLNVYNQQNEKLGDIKEVLIDASGRVAGVVVGVGGFLGMGEHDIMLPMNKLKFVHEPVRTSSSDPAAKRPATTGSGTNARRTDENMLPDHAVLNATKDQLKAMPKFKYM